MNPYRSHRQSAVPQTLHTRLEIANALRTLFGPDDDALLARRAEIAALRHDFQAFALEFPRIFEEATKQAKADLCLELKKYSPDQLRVPKGKHGGGQWTTESGSKAGTSAPSKVQYAANGDFPPAPEGYDPNTWKQGNWPNNQLWLEDPAGNKYTLHPEDKGHWRHWDKQDGDGNDLGRSPPDSRKPWPTQKRLKPDQSWTDPNGDAPPWTPNPLVPVVPEPILPANPVPTPKAPIEAIPANPAPTPKAPIDEIPAIRIPIPRIFFPG
jgi:hypothetical protein